MANSRTIGRTGVLLDHIFMSLTPRPIFATSSWLFCPTHRKGKIGAIPEFRAHHLCLSGADPTLLPPMAICRLVQWAPADSMLFTEG
jgi:hypothetical protein